jgi:hypothetical protein
VLQLGVLAIATTVVISCWTWTSPKSTRGRKALYDTDARPSVAVKKSPLRVRDCRAAVVHDHPTEHDVRETGSGPMRGNSPSNKPKSRATRSGQLG